jgi:hypothetical protein
MQEWEKMLMEMASQQPRPLCPTCEGWLAVSIACDVISHGEVYGPCPDCTNGYAPTDERI